MTIYAVMKTGGKEYRVAPGDVVRVEKLAAAPGATVEICEVSSVETAHGVTVGSPTVAGARVIADVVEEGHGEKILIFKKKRRDHYQMMTGDLHSYTVLRIREIAVSETVRAAAAPRREVAAAPTPPPPMPSAPLSSLPTQLVPPTVAAQEPIYPKVVSEEPASTQLQTPKPSRDHVRPVRAVESPPSAPSPTEIPPARFAPALRVVTEAPAPAVAEGGGRKRRQGIMALVAGVVVIAAGLVALGSRDPRAPGQAAVEVVTVAAPAQAAQPSAPPPAAKAPPRKELAVKRTAAGSAPSAPVQPPE